MGKIRWISCIIFLVFLSGCWDSVELDESIMVVGIGLSKKDNKYDIVIEALAPSAISPTETAIEGRSIILKGTSETLFDAARDVIKTAKRRLFFTHAEVWVIHNELAAEEDMLQFLDILRREQMLRLNSFLFVTDKDPEEILTTHSTFSNIISEELISGLEYVRYTSDYPSVKARDYFKMLLSPLRNGYLPFITTVEQNNEILSQFIGSAIFKDGQMVGQLDEHESFGLLWLNNEIQGGNITVTINDEKASFKLIRGDTDIHTQLTEDQLTVDINVSAEGTLADQNLYVESINEWIKDFSQLISEQIADDINRSLQKLQKEFRTDATYIGINVYRKQPHLFNKVKEDWDDIFAEANIQVNVDTKVINKGLIEQPGYHFEKPGRHNPYQLQKKGDKNGQ